MKITELQISRIVIRTFIMVIFAQDIMLQVLLMLWSDVHYVMVAKECFVVKHVLNILCQG